MIICFHLVFQLLIELHSFIVPIGKICGFFHIHFPYLHHFSMKFDLALI